MPTEVEAAVREIAQAAALLRLALGRLERAVEEPVQGGIAAFEARLSALSPPASEHRRPPPRPPAEDRQRPRTASVRPCPHRQHDIRRDRRGGSRSLPARPARDEVSNPRLVEAHSNAGPDRITPGPPSSSGRKPTVPPTAEQMTTHMKGRIHSHGSARSFQRSEQGRGRPSSDLTRRLFAVLRAG